MSKKISKVEQADELLTELEVIQASFRPKEFRASRPESEFPELFVNVPEAFETIELAPLYDVHIGSREHDAELFDKHLDWIANTPNVFTWIGGDAFENKIDPKMGHDQLSNQEQITEATRKFAKVQHKILFAIPGNHEDRTAKQSGISSAKLLADNLKVQFFSDYCFCTVKWQGNNFRITAHHGAGGAQTAGAQRNSARKELVWNKPDILWSGHLHQPIVDTIYTTDVDQKTGRMFERCILAIISPSYLTYFGGYAAHVRMNPGTRGLTVAVLNADGRIDASVHARGKRL